MKRSAVLSWRFAAKWLTCSVLIASITACGGGGGGGGGSAGDNNNSANPPGTKTYAIGGSLSGLSSGTLILKNNGGDNLSLTANGAFTFATKLTSGSAYDVTIGTQPAGITCAISSGGSGTVGTADIVNVVVVCTQNTSNITVTGHRLSTTAGFSMASRADGTVLIWGSNPPSAAGTPLSGTAATVITGASDARAVQAFSDVGTNFALALQSGGTVLGWGQTNLAMGLGVYTPGSSETAFSTPTVISQFASITQVKALFGGLTAALASDGTVWLLVGSADSITNKVSALQVSGLNNVASLGDPYGIETVTSIAQGVLPVIDKSGNVSLINIQGVSAVGTSFATTATVTAFGGLPAVSNVSCSGRTPYHCLALATDGSVWSWGNQASEGEIGDGTTVGKSIPVKLTGLPPIASVLAAYITSFAVDQSGNVYSWGGQFAGLLGRSSLNNCLTPTLIPGLSNVVEMSTNAPSAYELGYGQNALVRLKDGSVWGWGANYYGELGNGTTATAVTPVQAVGINLN